MLLFFCVSSTVVLIELSLEQFVFCVFYANLTSTWLQKLSLWFHFRSDDAQFNHRWCNHSPRPGSQAKNKRKNCLIAIFFFLKGISREEFSYYSRKIIKKNKFLVTHLTTSTLYMNINIFFLSLSLDFKALKYFYNCSPSKQADTKKREEWFNELSEGRTFYLFKWSVKMRHD